MNNRAKMNYLYLLAIEYISWERFFIISWRMAIPYCLFNDGRYTESIVFVSQEKCVPRHLIIVFSIFGWVTSVPTNSHKFFYVCYFICKVQQELKIPFWFGRSQGFNTTTSKYDKPYNNCKQSSRGRTGGRR